MLFAVTMVLINYGIPCLANQKADFVGLNSIMFKNVLYVLDRNMSVILNYGQLPSPTLLLICST